MSETDQTGIEQTGGQTVHTLTPDLIEDEAIRADFLLRWIVVLLAFLIACSEIDTTSTFVHIKSGEHLVEQGFIPSGVDPFSYTTEGRNWVNLNWCYDLVSAGLYSVTGAAGLVLLKAVLVSLAFYLIVNIRLPGVSSWWNSICATIAMIACYRQFTATPATITLLGVALLLWIIYYWRVKGTDSALWYVVILFFIWGQFDPRMFLGLWMLMMYLLGEYAGQIFGWHGLETDSQRKTVLQVAAVSLIVVLIHPFGWQTLFSAWQVYGVEYPVLRDRFPNPTDFQTLKYHSIVSPLFWQQLGRSEVACLLLWLTAGIAFVLNRKRVSPGEFCMFLGLSICPFLGVHELPLLAFTSAVLAGWNMQQWYRQTFRQSYRVEMNEVLFSRGGRAITVLAMTGLAYLAISGRLAGRNVNRIGLRFSPDNCFARRRSGSRPATRLR